MNTNTPPTKETTQGAERRQHRVDVGQRDVLDQDYQEEERELRRLHNERMKEENTTLKENRKMRVKLIWYVSGVATIWIVFTAVIVLLLGFKYKGFELSDAVMIAFLTTSLGTVAGLLGIGLHFLLYTG
jgi:hypothetical protein